VCLRSEEHYTYVHANAHVYVTELTLRHLEERLDSRRFVRVHRSAIVKTSRVARVLFDTVVTDTGVTLPLSRRRRGPLLELLG
jgi:DNA-binding LytR/AlgR family response regulator